MAIIKWELVSGSFIDSWLITHMLRTGVPNVTDLLLSVGFFVAGAALGALFAANTILIFAKLTHNDRLARGVVRLSLPVTWVFTLGSDGAARPRTQNGPIRA
jgi:hypothetical protein